ncbi:MAG: IS5 family transposase [Planctomycetota bacterium]|jgi:transposase
MDRKPYPSDLTDEEWKYIRALIPPAKPGGRPRSVNMREILNGILYVLRSGCAWRMLPHDLPAWSTVYDYFRKWRISGIWEVIHRRLHVIVRLALGRAASPSAGIVDSQSVKTSHRGGIRGYDGAKQVKGRKRHLLVDTQGFIMRVTVHAADIGERAGAKLLLEPLKGLFKRMKLIWVDAGYSGQPFAKWVKAKLSWKVEVVEHPWSQWKRGVWLPEGAEPPTYPAGFHVLPRRWVVERTFAWLILNRRFCRDYEYLPESSEALIYIAMSRLMARRLSRSSANKKEAA